MPIRRRKPANRNHLDIRSRLTAVLVAGASAVLGLRAGAQLLDGLEDVVDQEITEQVEQDVAEALEQAVEQQVESDVAEQIQEDIGGAIEEQLESEIVDAVQQEVESGVVATITTLVEESVIGEVGEQLLDAVEGEIDAVARELDGVPGELLNTARSVAETAEEIVDRAADAGSESREPFAAGVDALGRTIEGEVWIVLVPSEHAGRIASWGFTIRERRDLAAMNRVLLRVAAPVDRDIAQAALELALDSPGTEVDFNHVYRPGAEPAADTLTAVPGVQTGAAARSPAPALSVGVVDTAVAIEHDALESAHIVQRDFVTVANERPTAHGTAIASILVGDGTRLRPQLRGGHVYAASVFFTDAEGDAAATAESLTLAGEWLAAEGVRVINLSLAGPPNRVLEAAIATLVERGIVVVAAVGNNGPAGEPLYPAAYATVVGVTAVDEARRVYRYANRGPHVRFAAPGVDIRVAKSGGGYREMTGTSVAAPHAAAVIASTLASRPGAAPAAVVAELQRAAVDLGATDFDSVFGFGLIAAPTPVTASR